jgi:predicted tellurium resistance membrane protein TerC
VVFGSTLMIRVMQRFPSIVVLGAGLIGWVAGETIVGDVGLHTIMGDKAWLHYAASAAGAVLVIGIGKILATRAR